MCQKPPLNLCFLNLGTLAKLPEMEAIARGQPTRKSSKFDFLLSHAPPRVSAASPWPPLAARATTAPGRSRSEASLLPSSSEVVDDEGDVSDEDDLSGEEDRDESNWNDSTSRTDTEAILLTNNSLESLVDFVLIFQPRIHHLSNLKWLDLSFNLLTKLDAKTLAAVPNLIILNLHANRFVSLRSLLVVLAPLTRLRSLTLQANPLSSVVHLRLLVAHALPSVHRLDHVTITRSEREPELRSERMYVNRFFDHA
jgi:hypothetical protein